jgi:cellulose synthase/poly-beta-1,6-N-acetylglucosamine synthase-like glycosyltransferase
MNAIVRNHCFAQRGTDDRRTCRGDKAMRVSIVICNYNYARFLDGAIRSALEQDHLDKEVIVVDDGSTDGSREVIARWADAVRTVYKANGGQVSAYNAGFEQVTGDAVVFLDSDDCSTGAPARASLRPSATTVSRRCIFGSA